MKLICYARCNHICSIQIPNKSWNYFRLSQTFSELSAILLNHSESPRLCISGDLSPNSVLNLISWYLNIEDSLKWMEISQPGISTNWSLLSEKNEISKEFKQSKIQLRAISWMKSEQASKKVKVRYKR